MEISDTPCSPPDCHIVQLRRMQVYITQTHLIIVHMQLNSANEENTTQNKNQEGFIFSFNNIYRLYINKALQAAIF